MVDFDGIKDADETDAETATVEIDATEKPIKAFKQYVSDKAADGSQQAIDDDVNKLTDGLDALDISVLSADESDIRTYFRYLVNETNLGDKTILRNEAHVRDLYQFLESEGAIETDPTADFSVKSHFSDVTAKSRKEDEGDDRVHYLVPEEVDDLREACPSVRDKLIVQFLYATGAREVEARRIEIEEHLDRDNEVVRIPTAKKRGSDKWEPRPVPYGRNRQLKYLLSEWLDHGKRRAYGPADESPYLFVTQRSEKFARGKMTNIIKKRAHDAGIQEEIYTDASGKSRWKVTAHTLRHSAGYAMAMNGASAQEIKEMLGHSDLDTVQEYMKWAGQDVVDMTRDKMPR